MRLARRMLGTIGNSIPLFDGAGFFIQIADILVIQIDVDIAAEFAPRRYRGACTASSPCCEVRPLRTFAYGVSRSASTVSCLPAYCRRGVGIITFAISVLPFLLALVLIHASGSQLLA